MRRARATLVLAAAACAMALLAGAGRASAHPLGNFSVNQSHRLTFERTRIVDHAVVDFAEIPTAQAGGQLAPDELAARGRDECAALAGRTTLTVDGESVGFVVATTSLTTAMGQAGLPTSRLTCDLEAAVDLSAPRTVAFAAGYEPDRIGWREISATGTGVGLVDSPVPTMSPTNELRQYPSDLLSSPLDVRELTVGTRPGSSTSVTDSPAEMVTAPGRSPSLLAGGPLASVVERVSARFDDLVGRRDLTLGVGLLAVALAMVLGASHALLPGHGKTVMAAYIAGRDGSTRDAVVVGATVTATHTGGVLLLGLALTVSSSLTGESVLAWLGVVSGTIIVVLGAGLLRSVRRHEPGFHGHRHAVAHAHPHGGHDHDDRHRGDGHDHHGHDHHDHHDHEDDHHHGHGRGHTHGAEPVRAGGSVGRRGLIGMGVAGGLVPSPSALIVLLSAIALGRTAFGILLVIGYGAGMAATLTLAGLLLVRIRDHRRSHRRERSGLGVLARRWTLLAPYVMAMFVVAVGIGIAMRGLQAV